MGGGGEGGGVTQLRSRNATVSNDIKSMEAHACHTAIVAAKEYNL